MQSITLQSHVGEDGKLLLNIATDLSNTDLEVTVLLRPIVKKDASSTESFSQWWAKQLTQLAPIHIDPELKQDPRFSYLAERYNL